MLGIAVGKYIAMIDDNDLLLVRPYSWHAKPKPNTIYAQTDLPKGGGVITMHRFIMGSPTGSIVHHIDGNGLNNQRANLMITTQSHNLRMARARSDRPLQFRGVYRHGKGFRAILRLNSKNIYLGTFQTQEEAALAYDGAARAVLGSGNFVPNFPDE